MASKVRDLAHPISMAAYEATDGQSRPNDHPTSAARELAAQRDLGPDPVNPATARGSPSRPLASQPFAWPRDAL